ncbi:mitochondrial genome maintenance MGM101 [Ascodesmis nigricans]|uniref:Mitochondrial genome maintenance protein MGM101 n=1 Tax=Ascodesmis nigricans TaxID=341454 RepID=A0A4S2N7L1_9PEZI|nr:mitochondrial genome maintenance MGM101 [Ascodesmis nigricans]
MALRPLHRLNLRAALQRPTIAPRIPLLVRPQSTDKPSSNVVLKDFQNGLEDDLDTTSTTGDDKIDWSRSFHGMSAEAFPKEAADVLMAPLDPNDIEIKPDGILYLPEIKYRRILNKAFGPGGWGLAPRGPTTVTEKVVSREYALVANGRLVAIARGEQQYFDPNGIPTASEGCRSNALMRTCKDVGIASELWDPRFIRKFKSQYCEEKFAEHVTTKKKKKIWRRKGDPIEYPWKVSSF